MEYAIVSLLQLIAGEHDVAAPTAFIKVFHAAKRSEATGQPEGYIGRVIQAGLGVPGISFQHLIELVLSAQKLSACAGAEECYDAFLRSEELTQAFLKKHPIIQKWSAQDFPKSLDQQTKEKLHEEVLPKKLYVKITGHLLPKWPCFNFCFINKKNWIFSPEK